MNFRVDVVLHWAFSLGPFALGFGLWCLALPAGATPTLEQEQEIRTTFVTPHTPWAKPYAGGTTRVLFFSDDKNTQAREIVELMQRFEVQADAAYYTRVKVAKKPQMQWHGGEEGIARIRRLLDSGAHDVFLFNGVSPDGLPAALKQDLLARVAQGKGLVLVGVKQRGRLDPPLANDPDRVALDEPLILDAPLARRAEAGDPDAELFALKQGRAARLPAAPVADYAFGWEIPYDHWQERLGRTVLWAAGKLPAQPLPLRRDPGTDAGMVAKSSPEARLVVTLPAEAPIAHVRIRERRDDGLVVRDSMNPLPPGGGGHFSNPLPPGGGGPSSNPLPPGGGGLGWGGERPSPRPQAGEGPGVRVVTGPPAAGLPAGRYHDEVIATDASGRVVAWATLPFVVATPHTVNLELSRTWGEIGDALAGTATVAGPALANGRVSVELRDRRGRMLAATPAPPANAGATPFSFAIPEWYPMLVQVRAVLRNEVGDVADAVSYFNVTKRHRDQFNFLSWDIPRGPTAAWAHEALAGLGVTLELGKGNPPPVMAAYEMAMVPYTTRILAKKDERGWIKPLPWNQEPEIQRYVEELVAQYAPARQHGVFAYSLGDETVTRGSDTSPSDLAAYRRYLQGVYGAIAALNASWDADYAGFEAIELLDANDPTEEGAKRAGNDARWYDRQAWESANFLGLNRRFGEAFRRLDPRALTGFEGAGRLERADDIEGIVRTNGFWTPYRGSGDQVVRGIAPREFPYANWMGSARHANSHIWFYWRTVLNGGHGVWYWRWDNIGRFMGLLRPDLSPFDEVAEMLEETRITREGLGDLLIQSEKQTDGVALLYSHPSMYATQLAEGSSYGKAADDHAAWQQALFNLGIGFDYVTDAMLRQGDWDTRNTRVLILPRTEALGDEEAKRIRAFVEAGGTVIADLRPGRFTGRVKPRTAGALDALFGVGTESSAKAQKRVEVAVDDGASARWRFGGMTVDPGIQAKGAIARGTAGHTPVLLTHAVGKGQAILLNFSLADAPRIGSADAPLGAAEWLREILMRAGVRPALALARMDGGPTGDLRLQRWRIGEIELIGIMWVTRDPGRTRPDQQGVILQDADVPHEYVLTLASPRWIYDLRTQHNWGRQRQVNLSLRPGRATFLALMPDAAPAVAATLAPSAVAPGQTAELRVSVPDAVGDHAVWVTAIKPDGSEADWVRTARVIPRGETVGVPVPIALNDPSGRWVVRLKELYTNRMMDTSLVVEPEKSKK